MLKLKSEEYSAGQIKQEAQVTVIIQVTVLKLTFTPFSIVYFYKNTKLYFRGFIITSLKEFNELKKSASQDTLKMTRLFQKI